MALKDTENMPLLRRKSNKITQEMRSQIQRMLILGFLQHDIAAMFGINQGRVSELKNRKK